ncbi:MAG: LysR family transcriptional regulator [Oscillospiraceae bacterium]|nr:LysR family transcriptional regulator [Oscillospiraceae bacterium]
MDFSLLRSFIAVAEEKSFSTAAKHLFISQQTLSKQIAKIEEELDTVLLVRSRPLALTPDGKHFLKVAKEILQLKQQFEESSSRSISRSHFIHMGIEHTIARALLPHVLPKYVDEHPDTYVKVSEESPDMLQKAIVYEGVDLVIGSLCNVPDNYVTVPLCPKEYVLIVPKNILRDIAGDKYESTVENYKDGVDLGFFQCAPFIRLSRRVSGGRALSSYLKYYDVAVRFVCEVTNVENAFQLANSGLGLFIYPRIFWDMMAPELQRDYLNNIHIFPLPHLPEIEPVCAYYNKESGIHGKNLELLEQIKYYFNDYMQQLKGTSEE